MFDFKTRVRNLQSKLAGSNFDGAVLFRPEHIYYFGGFWGYWIRRYVGLVIPASGQPVLVVPAIEEAYARASTWVQDVRPYVEWQSEDVLEDPIQAVGNILREKGLTGGRLGIEGAFLPANLHQQLQSVASKSRIEDVESLCTQLRMIKEPAEIEVMRQAGRVTLAEMEAALEVIRPGIAEYEIGLSAKSGGTRMAAEILGPNERRLSPLISGVHILTSESSRADWVHGRPSTYRLNAGDVVYLCFCEIAHFKGYNIGFDRPAPVGRVSPEKRKLGDTVLAAQRAAINKIRPGEIAANIDAAANTVLNNAGLLQYRLHRTGRGIGVEPAEPPMLKSSDRTVLQPGMVLVVSPGVYVPGFGNAHFGDTVLVTQEGVENLTPFEKNWWDGYKS